LSAIFGTSGPLRFDASPSGGRSDLSRFLNGFVLELSNPKALLYFSSLLPQFVDPSGNIFLQLTILCGITFALDLTCYSLYALLGVQSAGANVRPGVAKWINRTAGSLLIFAGVKMAALER